jgi:hypothetical protein
MARILYAIFGLTLLTGYSLVSWRGYTFATRRQTAAGGLRGASHTGYRSFWYSGFHGGK